MHDIRLIRDDPAFFDKDMARRGLPPQSQAILEIDAQRRATQTELQTLPNERNSVSRAIGRHMAEKQDTLNKQAHEEIKNKLSQQVSQIKESITLLEAREK